MTVIVEEGEKQYLEIVCSTCGHIFRIAYDNKITLDMLICDACGTIL